MSRWIPRRMLCLLRRFFLLSRYHLSLLFLLWIPELHRFPLSQALDFHTDSSTLLPTEPLQQGNSDFRTLLPRLRHNCLVNPFSPGSCSPPHTPRTSPSSPCSVTPTVSCVQDSCPSVDVLNLEPWASLVLTSRDSFSWVSPSPLSRIKFLPFPIQHFPDYS